jgi:hypothetical protein
LVAAVDKGGQQLSVVEYPQHLILTIIRLRSVIDDEMEQRVDIE